MRKQNRRHDDMQPLDPVALSLAIWVSLVVAATGLQRLAAQASLHMPSHTVADASAAMVLVPPGMAYGM